MGVVFTSMHGYVKRKGTKAAKKIIGNDIEEIKVAFLTRIKTLITDHHIPTQLVLNWDQTGVSIIPAGEWTMEKQGSSQVTISGLDDKHQITAVFTSAADGHFLPPHLLYQGKTE